MHQARERVEVALRFAQRCRERVVALHELEVRAQGQCLTEARDGWDLVAADGALRATRVARSRAQAALAEALARLQAARARHRHAVAAWNRDREALRIATEYFAEQRRLELSRRESAEDEEIHETRTMAQARTDLVANMDRAGTALQVEQRQ
jgi:hypothetical protein